MIRILRGDEDQRAVTFRVYVVDDDLLATRQLATDLSRERGLEAETFSSSAKALEAAHAVPPDAVLARLRMHETGGLALLSELHTIDPEIVGILVTGAADVDEAAEAVSRVGPLHHVIKPYDMNDLLPKLRAGLERRQLLLDLRGTHATLDQRDRALSASKRQVARAAAELVTTSTELETATERLVQSEQLAAVGRVLTGIAHELDRQLALVGYAEAIKSRVGDDPELAEFADIIVNAHKRLSAMVDVIRDFASTGAEGVGAAQLEREPADLAAVVDEALMIMRFDRDVRERTIERAYGARPLAALHRQKFGQVIMNLVSNAVLATKPGDTVTIEVDADAGAHMATVRVIDHGTGMPSTVLARLGEPFFTTRGEAGSGLGVGICRQIVEEHGGRLTFDSAVGAGTTALVTVPMLLEPAAEDAS